MVHEPKNNHTIMCNSLHSLAEEVDHNIIDIHDEVIVFSILKKTESTYQVIKIELRKVHLSLHRQQ